MPAHPDLRQPTRRTRVRTLASTALVFVSLLACVTPQTASPNPAGNPPRDDTDPTSAAAPDPAPGPPPATGDPMAESPHTPPTWDEVDRLVADGKMKEALGRVEAQLTSARTTDAPREWTHALVKVVQLRTALHGYETAVRFLRDQPWPEAQPYRTVVALFYAETLVQYLQAYSWEIGQRETVVTIEPDTPIDLRQWTAGQLYDEIQRTYAEIWAQRARWGDASIGVLGSYVEQNDFPARIRGTLRDTVGYLWTRLLADSALWPAGTADDVHTLDRTALIDRQPGSVDEASHPLTRLAVVLGDLEAWHADRDRPEAAFEARRVRLTRLGAHLDGPGDAEALIDALERALDRLTSRYPWWSMGMASLAGMVEQRDPAEVPDALARAAEIAHAGARPHPDSPGGERCRHLAARLEAPSYQLAAMAVDGPGRRSIEVRHQNLETLHFRAYRVDLDARLGQPLRGGLLPTHHDVPALLRNGQPVARWSVGLPPTPDLRSHRTDVVPPLDARGIYLVVASARGDFRQGDNELQAVTVQRSDLVLITRSHENRHEVTVRSGATGTVVAGARVELVQLDHRNRTTRIVAEQTTDTDGRTTFALAFGRGEQHVIVVRHGDDVVVDAQRLTAFRPAQPRDHDTSLVYTDRSIYRPGQNLYWKVVAYRRPASRGGPEDHDRFAILPDREVTITLRDANGQEVGRAQATTNDFGSASGAMAIPAGRVLGDWHLTSDLGGQARVAVEAYKRPTFEVEVTEPANALRLNRPAVLRGQARYYFGLPVTAGQVRWRVTREPHWPPWLRGAWWWPRPTGGSRTVAAGIAPLDADGAFDVTFTPAADERLAGSGVSYRYRLRAEVTDDGGETRTGERSFQLGFVAVRATIDQERGFFTPRQPVALTIRRSDLDGTARAGAGQWSLMAVDQPTSPLLPADQPLPQPPKGTPTEGIVRTEGDERRARWSPGYAPQAVLDTWADGSRVANGRLSATDHDDEGQARLELGTLAPGVYRLRYTTNDRFGARFEIAHEVVVVASDAVPALPTLLLVDRHEVAVGDEAEVWVSSGFDDQPMVVEVLRGDETVRRETLIGGGHLLQLPITEADRGGLTVRLGALRDHQHTSLVQTVTVPWDNRALDIELSTFRDRLRPGDDETWRITLRGAEGPLGAGAAELLAYMYDRSLDLFARHEPPTLVGTTLLRRATTPPRVNLGAAPRVWNHRRGFGQTPNPRTFRPDRLIFLDGWGVGGPGGGLRMHVSNGVAEAMPAAPMMRKDAVAFALAAPAQDAAASMAQPESLDAAPPPTDDEAEAAPELRTDFAETAFWEPHLLTDGDGAVSFTFTVPDAVTEWNVFFHALTRDLRVASKRVRARTVKELLVRPYVPRFLREGDEAAIEVVVSNTGEAPLDGTLTFEIIDPETEVSRGADFGLRDQDAPFQVAAGESTSLAFPITVPPGVGDIAFRVIGRAGSWSDGELRPLPVLPGRFHLAQSRFAALRGGTARTLRFDDLAADEDATRIDERLVVTIDGQLFYSVLNALPYLFEHPYPSTDAVLERFVATGILSRLFDDVPAVARMAADLAARDTPLPAFDGDDANRTMALEETPWLRTARGESHRATGPDGEEAPMLRLLDPRVAVATRDTALATLRQHRNGDGGFPWFPGGPSSPYVTMRVVYGFAKALELGAEVPRDLVAGAWRYLEQHYRNDLASDDPVGHRDLHLPAITLLNYVLSSYPDLGWTDGVFTDDDRRVMLARSFERWRDQAPLLKGYLALTLARAGRAADARLVFDSVLDSATTSDDLGTHWMPEERAWLWYNDTVEGHAFALRVLTELAPDDPRRDGLVHWLLLNKHLNHWRSTRTTAEVLYALTHHLRAAGQLGVTEAVGVRVGPRDARFVFAPDAYTGADNQLVIAGAAIDPTTMARVELTPESEGLMFASATWHFSTESLPDEARGDLFAIERRYFLRVDDGDGFTLRPLAEGTPIRAGDQVEVQISIRAGHAAEYVHLRDPRGAGFEPEGKRSGWRWDRGLGWYEEIRDSGTHFFFEWLPAGQHTFRYRLRAAMAGRFKTAPAVVQSVYAPEFVAYSAGHRLTIDAADGPR